MTKDVFALVHNGFNFDDFNLIYIFIVLPPFPLCDSLLFIIIVTGIVLILLKWFCWVVRH